MTETGQVSATGEDAMEIEEIEEAETTEEIEEAEEAVIEEDHLETERTFRTTPVYFSYPRGTHPKCSSR